MMRLLIQYNGTSNSRRTLATATPAVAWRRESDQVLLTFLDGDGRKMCIELERLDLKTIGSQLRALGWADYDRMPLLAASEGRS